MQKRTKKLETAFVSLKIKLKKAMLSDYILDGSIVKFGKAMYDLFFVKNLNWTIKI